MLKLTKNKNYWKVRDYFHDTGKYRGAKPRICNLKLMMPVKIPVLFHNSSNYDCHFIVKELANKFEGKFECPGEYTEKYKTFSITIEKKVIKADKDSNESVVTINYKITFIDSAKIMATSSSNLFDSLAE